MRKLIVGIVGATALATVGMAAAANGTVASDQTFSNSAAGIYVGGGLGYGDVLAKGSTYSSTATVSQGAFAWDALVGYQFNQYVALEANYINFGHSTLHDINEPDAKDSLSGFGADVKGIYPVNSEVEVFGTAGVIRMEQKLNVQGTDYDNFAWTPDLGVGVAYTVVKNVSVTAQDIYAFKNSNKNIPAANAMLAGVSYKFNI